MLEVDHIVPVVCDGDNDEGNLVTACQDCNRGKAGIPLTVVPESLMDRAARFEEAEAQLAGYRGIVEARARRVEEDVWQIVRALFGETTTETTHARFRSIKVFLARLPIDEIEDAAEIAKAKLAHSQNAMFKYFCGICWRKIKLVEDPAPEPREPDELDRALARLRQ